MNKIILSLILITLPIAITIVGIKLIFNAKKYTTKGYAKKIGFSKLTFSYPVGWKVTEEASLEKSFDKIQITKNNYSIHIDQLLLVGGGDCKFNDSPNLPGPSMDLSKVEYKEMDSNFGHLRYFRFPSESGSPTNSYSFCMKDQKRSVSNNNFYSPPDIGYISLDVPDTQNILIFQEALNIIRSIKKIE